MTQAAERARRCRHAHLPLAREFLHGGAEILRVHRHDDLVLLGVELLLHRRRGGLVDQRLGAGDRRGRVLRQPLGEFSRRRLQLGGGNDLRNQAPFIGLLRGKIVLGQENLQRAAGADRADDADRRAAIRRHADLGIGRRELGFLRGDAEIGDEGEAHAGAGGRAVHAGQRDLRHAPDDLDEGVIVLQQLADDRRHRAGFGRGTDRLQIAAGREGAAFAFEDHDPDVVGALDVGRELFELLRDRKVDRIERGGPVERDGRDRAVDPQQGGIIGLGDGSWHLEYPRHEVVAATKSQKARGDNPRLARSCARAGMIGSNGAAFV